MSVGDACFTVSINETFLHYVCLTTFDIDLSPDELSKLTSRVNTYIQRKLVRNYPIQPFSDIIMLLRNK